MRNQACVLLLSLAAACGYDGPSGPYEPPGDAAAAGLWVASGSDPAILRFSGDQLVASGARTARTTLTTSSATLFTVNGVAFDTSGTLWIASADDSRLIAFSPADLAVSGATQASRVLTAFDGSMDLPSAIAFDRQHRLWVASLASGALSRFDPAQLRETGAPVPATTIIGPTRPSALAFDASGGMWVANIRTSRVVRYSVAQLEESGALTPEIVLSALANSRLNPSALAFDADGNLWVAYIGSTIVASFAPDQLSATGTPEPRIVLSPAPGSFAGPVGLAFDDGGSLWVVSTEGALHRFAPSQLLESGAPVPSTTILVSGHTLLTGIAVWPKPGRLPLN